MEVPQREKKVCSLQPNPGKAQPGRIENVQLIKLSPHYPTPTINKRPVSHPPWDVRTHGKPMPPFPKGQTEMDLIPVTQKIRLLFSLPIEGMLERVKGKIRTFPHLPRPTGSQKFHPHSDIIKYPPNLICQQKSSGKPQLPAPTSLNEEDVPTLAE